MVMKTKFGFSLEILQQKGMEKKDIHGVVLWGKSKCKEECESN